MFDCVLILIVWQILDADNGCRLESSTGRVATRDIVQFVPMREVRGEYIFFISLSSIGFEKLEFSAQTSISHHPVRG